jgi:hypothetical protein
MWKASPSRLAGLILCSVLCLLGACNSEDGARPSVQVRPVAHLETLTDVDACETGHFTKGRSWRLQFHGNGAGDLTVMNPNALSHRSVAIGHDKIEKLKLALEENDFFGLPDDVGEAVPDSSVKKIRIRADAREKEVVIQFIPNERATPERFAIASRAISVWLCVRGLFEDKDAHDAASSYQEFLKGR